MKPAFKARLKTKVVAKMYFFRGQKADRSGVVARIIRDGFTILVVVSPRAKLIPSDGQRWEVELEPEFFAFEPDRKFAIALGLPLRQVELPAAKPATHTSFARVRSAVRPAEVVKETIEAVLAPAKPSTRQTRITARREALRQERQEKAPKKGPGGQKPGLGGGTSKKSLGKKRQRDRQQQAA